MRTSRKPTTQTIGLKLKAGSTTDMEEYVSRTSVSFYGPTSASRAATAEGLALNVQKTFKGELTSIPNPDGFSLSNLPALSHTGNWRLFTESFFAGEENYEKQDYSYTYGRNTAGTAMEVKRMTVSLYEDDNDTDTEDNTRAASADGLALKQQVTYKATLTPVTGGPMQVTPARKLSTSFFAGDENFEKTDYTQTIGLKLKAGSTTDMEEYVSRTSVSFYGPTAASRAATAEGLALNVQKTFKGELTSIPNPDGFSLSNLPALSHTGNWRLLTESFFAGEENYEKQDCSYTYGRNTAE